MRKMNKEEREYLRWNIRRILQSSVSDEYVSYILAHESEETDSTLLNDVMEDVMETSAWDDAGYYNDDDIRLSIGRIIMERLGIDE